mmetsp:Transcript_16698/g.14613  ORF Transcript_16698/g.14613 Transcript_16698/m.14613 type:complete len:234 (+) Transcript_16698:3-704(+)
MISISIRMIKLLICLCLATPIIKCGYNESLAEELMFASALAYCPPSQVLARGCMAATEITELLGMTPILSFDNDDQKDPIFMTILERKKQKQIIVSFSGTKGPSELIDEIEGIFPKSYDIHENKGALVFGFFYDHYINDFRDELILWLTEITSNKNYTDYKILFTGHSLGGALTLHAAADAILSGLLSSHKVSIYTFGQPRISNIEFFSLFLDNVYEYFRLVHNSDIVPHVPP